MLGVGNDVVGLFGSTPGIRHLCTGWGATQQARHLGLLQSISSQLRLAGIAPFSSNLVLVSQKELV